MVYSPNQTTTTKSNHDSLFTDSRIFIKMTKKQFADWLSKNRPDLEAYVTPHGIKGYYKIESGAAQSFKGFDTWAQAYEWLEGSI